MAICPFCTRDMSKRVPCLPEKVLIEGREYDPIPSSKDREGSCRDCGTPPGGLHHPGCDSERCPRCTGQLISCGCLEVPDEEPEE